MKIEKSNSGSWAIEEKNEALCRLPLMDSIEQGISGADRLGSGLVSLNHEIRKSGSDQKTAALGSRSLTNHKSD